MRITSWAHHSEPNIPLTFQVFSSRKKNKNKIITKDSFFFFFFLRSYYKSLFFLRKCLSQFYTYHKFSYIYWYRFESVRWMIWLRWDYRRWWKACKEQTQSKRRPVMTGQTPSDDKVSLTRMEFRMFGNKVFGKFLPSSGSDRSFI